MEIEMKVRGDERRRFTIQTSTIGEGGSALASILASHEIIALPRMRSHIDHYLGSWMTKLKSEAEAVQSRDHFGWHGREFMIGSTMLTESGPKRVVVAGNAASKASAFEPQGTLQEWVRIVDTAYNHPGEEAYQFMVMTAFAAPLLAMFQQFGGVTVYAHSEGSGVGKTTAQRVGLSAFGNWKDLQLADGKTTANALWGLFGTYANIPLVYDELTNQTNAMASEIVLSVSSGRHKERMNSRGGLNTNNHGWSTFMLASGNNLLSEKVSLHRGNAEAEISRLFEFTVRNSNRLSPNDAAELFPGLLDNYGYAGLEFLDYITRNYDDVAATLHKVQRGVNDVARITQPERYWSALFSCVLTALAYCRKLGLVNFDMGALRAWMLAELENNRRHRQESVGQPLELFSKMMTDLWQGVLVSIGEGDLRQKDGAATVIVDPRGSMTGRCVLPPATAPGAPPSNERPMLALNAAAVRDWCNKNGTSAREMFNAVVAAGYANPVIQRYALGRGCLKYASVSTPVKCWFIDLRKAGLDIAGTPLATIMREVKVGGMDA
jgi:hypothetical protein